MKDLSLMATLLPSFPHFKRFANDPRLQGVRFNTAMMDREELNKELSLAKNYNMPFYFDIKGRQLRVEEVYPHKTHLELELNYPIKVKTPVPVLFKAGEDEALLLRIEGNRLIFEGGPAYMVYKGESLHIRHPSLEVIAPRFRDFEIEKTLKAKEAGFKKFFLSYVESQNDVDEFRELVGKYAEIYLKIESKKGLEYVSTKFSKQDNLILVAARGDMYVEVDKPHDIVKALKLIIERDSEAIVGSRILLSIVDRPVPSCSDFCDLAYLYNIGYKNMMLCDELCLKEDLFPIAIDAFDQFRESYAKSLNGKSKKKQSIFRRLFS